MFFFLGFSSSLLPCAVQIQPGLEIPQRGAGLDNKSAWNGAHTQDQHLRERHLLLLWLSYLEESSQGKRCVPLFVFPAAQCYRGMVFNAMPSSLRSFILNMTSWKRGLTCQQRSTTIQPSRPSKAQQVQRLQLFLHTAPLSRRGRCDVHGLGFLFLEDSANWLQGSSSSLKLSCVFWISTLPEKPTCSVFILCSRFFVVLFVSFEQGLCYVYVSEPEVCLLPERRTNLVGVGPWQNKVSTFFISNKCSEHKKVGGKKKQSWNPQDTSERVK